VSFSKLKAATQRISESVSFTQVLRTGRSLTNLGECFAQVILGIISNGAPSIELSGMLKQIRARARRHVEGTGLRDLGSCLIGGEVSFIERNRRRHLKKPSTPAFAWVLWQQKWILVRFFLVRWQ
jgi:hypothetical protein